MDCLFCKIASGELKAEILFQDSEMMVIKDINPQAPFHTLVIPKKHIETINQADSVDEPLLGRMILCARKMAQLQGFADDGYRLIFNVNPQGGQTVYHIHLHVLGGRQLHWPPG